MARINAPPNATPFTRPDGSIDPAWAEWTMQTFRAAQMIYGSGTTADRPTKDLRPGGVYFDTSLGANGKPIWLNKTATGWVDATGAPA